MTAEMQAELTLAAEDDLFQKFCLAGQEQKEPIAVDNGGG